jgi:hypothetical protein
MSKVLTTNASIKCPHGGVGKSIPSDPKWTINGGTVLLENDQGTFPLTGPGICPFFQLPCGGYQLKSMGLNATQVDGRKVILDTDFNQTFTGLPLIIQEFHQTIDNSTVAPIPPGQEALPLPPELADIVKPVVTGVPPVLAFDLTTKLPPSLITTFTLFSDHPLQWALTLINEPDGSHSDITNGLPPLLVVAPFGGSWNTPTLLVTVTLTTPYLIGLKPGKYHFFMTAVNRRGLSSFAEVVLTVSP